MHWETTASMSRLNYKHLRYFWMVAKSGSVVRAAERLHLTPQSISGQLSAFEENLGVELLRRAGRGVELTDTGRQVLGYADEIFALGDELLDMLGDHQTQRASPFRVGIADSVQKHVAYRLVEPATTGDAPYRLICREGRLNSLLAELAVHRLDLVIADRPMPSGVNVRGFSHLLGESDISIFAAPGVLAGRSTSFPALLDAAPFLLPGEDVGYRNDLLQWFDANKVRPAILGEFDDSALTQAFAQGGAGFFAAPTAVADSLARLLGVEPVGRIGSITEKLYAITTERRLVHPAILAVRTAARDDIFKAVPAPAARTPRRRSPKSEP